MRYLEKKFGWVFFIVLLMGLGMNVNAGDNHNKARKYYRLDIPRQSIEDALESLSVQTRSEILYSFDLVDTLYANAVQGTFTLERALGQMLKGTGLSGGLTESGAIIISTSNKGDSEMNIKRNLLAAAIGGFFAAGALASDGDDLGWLLEEVVVTAQKRSQSIQDTAMSITALSTDTIDRRNLVGMNDYLSSLPGVTALDQGPGFNSVVIRGLAVSPQYETGTINGVYFGEIPISGLGFGGNSADIKLVDIERVEVLRGPQGTLYGAAAMCGVVRNIPVAPNLNQVEGLLSAGYSDTAEEGGGNSTLKGVINIPLIEDTLAVRGVLFQIENSGYYKNIAGSDPGTLAAVTTYGAVAKNQNDVGNVEAVGGRVSVLWQPTEQLSITASYIAQDNESEGWAQEDVGADGDYTQRRLSLHTSTAAPDYGVVDEDEGYVDDIEITNVVVDYDLGWGLLSSSSSWVDETVEVRRDLSSFFSTLSYYPFDQQSVTRNKLFVEELRFESRFDGGLQFLVGLYYSEEERDADIVSLYAGNDLDAQFGLFGTDQGDIFLLGSRGGPEVDQEAIFGELFYDINEQIKLTIGARYFNYERTAKRNNFITKPDESGSSLKVGVEYTPDDRSLLYATWSEGFRLGTLIGDNTVRAVSLGCDDNLDGIYDGSHVSTGERLLESDFVESFEVGGKFSLLDNRLSLNTALFQIDWEGIPVTVQSGSCLFSINAGEAQSRGAEFDVSYAWTQNLLLNTSASYVDAEITEDTRNFSKGQRLPGSARFNFSLGIEYDFTLSGYNAYVRSDYSYLGGYYNNLDQDGTELGDYNKVNVKAGIAVGQFDIDIYVDNLTNEDALTWIDREISALERGNRLRPRTMGVNVGYRF